jgi:flavodoxin
MKAILYLLTLLVAVSASAGICSSVYAQPGNGQYEGHMNTVNLGKTLVVYYSFSGNTRGIAEYIAQKTDGTLFEIQTVEPYKATIKDDDPMSHVYEIANIVREQQKNGILPELKSEVVDIASYDTIIVGSPLWIPVPPPVLSFLAQHNLAGKRVAPFYTHRSTPGDYFNQFGRACPGAVLLPGEKFSHTDLSNTDKVDQWLMTLQWQLKL